MFILWTIGSWTSNNIKLKRCSRGHRKKIQPLEKYQPESNYNDGGSYGTKYNLSNDYFSRGANLVSLLHCMEIPKFIFMI